MPSSHHFSPDPSPDTAGSSTLPTVTVASPSGQITGTTKAGINYFHSLSYSSIPGDFLPAEKMSAPVDQDARTPRPDAVALSVVAPARARDVPVIVYIHGGRFESGSHEDPRADGSANARAGFVHVSLGYRVGLAGFARFLGDEPHRYRGIDDCQLALEWVQKNIEAFGGDPTNVTLVGQSAGAAAALWLARRDHYRGAFRRVLALSPCFPRQSYEKRKPALRGALKQPISRKSLAAMSKQRLDRGYARFRKKFNYDMALGPYPLDCAELADIPIVVTSTREEFYGVPSGQKADRSIFRRLIVNSLARKFGFPPNSLRGWYQVAESLDSKHVIGRMIGDATIRRWVAQVAEQAPGPTWMIEFQREGRPALHCDELRFLFNVHSSAAAARLNGWLHTFARDGETGFEAYRPEHSIWTFNLDTGKARITHGGLDYISAAFSDPE